MEEQKTYDQNQAYSQSQNNSAAPAYQQPAPPQPAKAVVFDTMPMKNNNMAIVGLIIGIFSLLGCWVPVWNLVLSIGGIISSAVGLSHKQRSNMAIGGLVMSIIGLLIAIVITLLYIAAIAMV